MAKNSFTDWDTTANNNTDVAGVNIAEGCAPSGINNAMRAMMSQLKGGVDGKVAYAAKSAGYTAVAADNNAYLRFTAGSTLALTAAATLGASWHCFIQANGGAVVIDPNGAETVNGAATVTIADGQSAFLICTGSAFIAYIIPGIEAANAWTGANTFPSLTIAANFANTQWGTGLNSWRVTRDTNQGTAGNLIYQFSPLGTYADAVNVLSLSSTGVITTAATLTLGGALTLGASAGINFSGTGAATTRTNLGFAGAIVAWVNFNGTGTVAIRASGNVSSITDNGTGDYTVNFTSALADANYAAMVTGSSDAGGTGGYVAFEELTNSTTLRRTTSAFRLRTLIPGTGFPDTLSVNAVFVR